jgi:hypothetical protein
MKSEGVDMDVDCVTRTDAPTVQKAREGGGRAGGWIHTSTAILHLFNFPDN